MDNLMETVTGVYVGLRECGCCAGAIYDAPAIRDDVTEFVTGMVDDGLEVKRVSLKVYKSGRYSLSTSCPHEKEGDR